jgi:carbonic anhydrase
MDLDLQGRTAPSDPEAFTEAYEACSAGLAQLALVEQASATPVQVSLRYRPTPLLADTGADGLRAFFSAPSFMVRERVPYRLVSLHLHQPDTADDPANKAPLLAHLVHYGADGSYGVLGLRVTEGAPNPELDKLILAAVGEETSGGLNPRRLLPPSVGVGAYLGPEDIPDCEYQVHWHFADEPLNASGEQIRAMQKLLGFAEG